MTNKQALHITICVSGDNNTPSKLFFSAHIVGSSTEILIKFVSQCIKHIPAITYISSIDEQLARLTYV